MIIGLLLHHVMKRDEPVLVFQNTYLETQLNRHACLAFTDPFSVGFENGEYFFLMGNHFVFEHTVRDLVSLASNVLAIALDFKLQKSLGGGLGDQSGQGGLNSCPDTIVPVQYRLNALE